MSTGNLGNPSEESSLGDPSVVHYISGDFALTYEIVEQSTKRGRQKLTVEDTPIMCKDGKVTLPIGNVQYVGRQILVKPGSSNMHQEILNQDNITITI